MIQKFNDALAEGIDEVIRNVFGYETAENILRCLNDSNSRDLDERLQIFADALHRILGAGAPIIEDLILKTLQTKLGVQLDREKDYGFAKCIMELKARLERNSKVKDRRGRLRKAVESILLKR